MGEPFLQLRPGHRRRRVALVLLRGLDRPRKAITISTVGLVPEIDRYTAKGTNTASRSASAPRPTRSGRGSSRSPRGRPIAEVMAAARRHALDRRDRVMLVLRLHLGRERRRGRRAGARRPDRRHPRPPRPDRRHRPDRPVFTRRPTDEMDAFRDALSRHVGQPVVRRYSGGKDIQAACGTLAGAG